MRIQLNKKFIKDFNKLNTEYQNKTTQTIHKINSAKSFQELTQIKKIQGTKDLYRIRISTHRIITLKITQDTISLERVVHKKNTEKIYKQYMKQKNQPRTRLK